MLAIVNKKNEEIKESFRCPSVHEYGIKERSRFVELSAEESQGRWSVEGIAHFADILRNYDQDNSSLYNTIISELEKYTKANQGSLFVVQDEDPKHVYLNQEACCAYERRKYLQKRVEPGEGLVGQAYLEKEEIFLTDVPAGYL